MAVVSDPIADMLTRIRNAVTARHTSVDVPVSKMKREIAKILHRKGFIRGYQLVDRGRSIRIRLKYDEYKEPVLHELTRVSVPGQCTYAGKDDLPFTLGGLGMCIVSTSQGILTADECRKRGIGGEVIAEIW